MRRPQFSIRALLVAMLAAACFFGGIHFERERRRREDEAATAKAPTVPKPFLSSGSYPSPPRWGKPQEPRNAASPSRLTPNGEGTT
jgi:hypothetical protein